MQEKENREKEIAEAKKKIDHVEQQKAAIQKKQQHVMHQMADGLYYRDDGKKFFANGQEVNGANNLVQSESK